MSIENPEIDISSPVTTEDIGDLTAEDAIAQLRKGLLGEEINDSVTDEEPEKSDEVDEDEDIEEEEQSEEESEEEEEIEEDASDDVEEEEEIEDEEESDDDELNLDEDLEDDGSDKDDDDVEEEAEVKETAVDQLRKVSKLNKELTADNTLLNEQLVSMTQQMEEVQSQLDKMSATKVDPTSHPDFIEVRTKTHNGIASQLRRAIGTDKTKLLVGSEKEPRWGKILTEVATLDELPFDEQEGVENNLRLHIAQRLGFQGDELDSDIDDEYIEISDKVIKSVGNFSDKYHQLADMHQTILNKSQTKSLEIGHKDYAHKTRGVREGMAIIETMSDKDIQEDPDSLQALAARKIQRSPQMKTQFDKIKKAVIEMAYGPEALSQEELDKHAATGKDMEEFHKNRAKRVETFRNERLTEIAAAMLIWPEIKSEMPKYFRNKHELDRTKSKKKVLRQGKKLPSKVKKKTNSEDQSVESHKSKIAAALGM